MRSGVADYRDEARLEHMMRAARRIREQMDGLERSMLREGDDRSELIIYNIQVLGEAANNVSAETCAKHPGIDFKGWAGLRHRLVHDYANIDFDIIWDAITNDLPVLERHLAAVAASMPECPPLPDNIEEFL